MISVTRHAAYVCVPGDITFVIMQKKKLLSGILSAAILFSAASCTKEVIGPEVPGTDAISSKLIFTSENAAPGSLLVYFSEEAVAEIEGSAPVSGPAVKSGISDLDIVLSDIGAKSLTRLFPVDSRSESRTREAGLHRWYAVSFDEDTDLDMAARQIASMSEVKNVEFNQKLVHVHDSKFFPLAGEDASIKKLSASSVSFNDPHLAKQWHYINTGDKSIYSGIKEGADVNCAEAWRLCSGDPRIVVAVVDNCVQWDHPDLAANMWVNTREQSGSAGADDDGNGYKDDVHGYNFASNTVLTLSTYGESPEHGTHVAGTVAAVNNNGTGVCGVAGGSGNNDGVKIMSCQVFHNDKGGTVEASARAIKYAADNGAAIIQCSYGYTAGAVTSDEQFAKGSSAEKQAIDYFLSSRNCDALDGGLAIFASGNDMYAMSGYPAAYKECISVTAMSCDYTPAYYTNYGPGCNIAAPGGDVYQSYIEKGEETSSVLSTIPGGGYAYSQGTSMACPHVSGVAALGLSYALQTGKKFTRNEFTALLLTSVNNIDRYCTGTKRYYTQSGSATLDLSRHSGLMGGGYIDAYQVLMNVRGTTCVPIEAGKQVTLDILKYIGDGEANLKIRDIEISSEDMQRLGMSSKPTIFGNKIILKCANAGSAIIGIQLQSGTSSGGGISGMNITKEFALVVRNSHSDNGGWL